MPNVTMSMFKLLKTRCEVNINKYYNFVITHFNHELRLITNKLYSINQGQPMNHIGTII